MTRLAIEVAPARVRVLGQNIRTLRTQRGLTTRQLSDKAGISDPMLRHIEAGENSPSLWVYVALCEALRLPRPALT